MLDVMLCFISEAKSFKMEIECVPRRYYCSARVIYLPIKEKQKRTKFEEPAKYTLYVRAENPGIASPRKHGI